MTTISEALTRLLPKSWRAPGAELMKGSQVGPLIAYGNLGQPVWAPRDYATFAREGFMQNAIVYRSVRMIGEAAATIPLLLYEGDTEIEAHPLLDLIRRPSHDHTGTDFFESWYGFLLVAGNAYVEAVALDGALRELHILRPDRMKVIPGPDGWPEGYEYTAGGQSIRFQDEPVAGVRPILHVRLFHPANDHYGMSPIEAAATAIDIHNTASGWNKALLDNSARPSGALVYAASNGQMTGEQFERLKAELETSFQGAAHAGRPLLLEGGLDWKPLSLTPKDMDFIEAKNSAAREIALALGVPPMLLGIPGDNTYSNYAEAQRAFWRQTVLPLVNRTAKAMSSWLAPAFGGDLELRADLDQVEAFASERDALWSRLQGVSFLTDGEKRAAAGYAALLIAPSDSASRSRPEGAGDAESPNANQEVAEQGAGPFGRNDAGDAKYNPNHDELGLFTTPENTVPPKGGRDRGDGRVRVAQAGAGPHSIVDASESSVEPVNARRTTRQIRIGGRTLDIPENTPNSVVEVLRSAAERADTALARVRELDPEWRPSPSLTDPQSLLGVQGNIAAYRSLAQQAEARATVIDRGGVPLGFNSMTEFQSFSWEVRSALSFSGYGDAEPYLRGSSVTGFSYRTGEAFDVGRRSDLDFAIVSPRLLERAKEVGIKLTGSGVRTARSLTEKQLKQLGLETTMSEIRSRSRQESTIMIYRDVTAIEKRGPSVRLLP